MLGGINSGGGPITITVNVEVHGDFNIYNYGGVMPPTYSVLVTQIQTPQKGISMADKKSAHTGGSHPATGAIQKLAVPKPGGNSIPIGGQGSFVGQLLSNGNPINLPSGATWQWTTDDPSATIQIDPSDPSGGTVIISIPDGDTNTQITITAATNDPNGNPVSGSLTVPLTSGAQVFSVSVVQIA